MNQKLNSVFQILKQFNFSRIFCNRNNSTIIQLFKKRENSENGSSHSIIRSAHTDISPPSFEACRYTSGDDYKSNYHKNRNFTYLMTGASTIAGAYTAKHIITTFVGYMSAAADVLALSKIEVNLRDIAEGTTLSVMWRGKPIFIRHRTAQEIEESHDINLSTLRDPQLDSDRVKDPKYLIMVGVCTHLGCIPIGNSGDYNGWFCPCHGSHYDISGRIRKGPAPLNLEIPPYSLIEGNTIAIIG